MSTTALHIIELVKSLPDEDQQSICAALTGSRATVARSKRRQLQHRPDGTYFHPEGLPNDDPLFKVLERIEEERHALPGPPPPAFD